MPLGFNPNRRVPVTLPSDEAEPEATRPTFYAHFMTCAETIEYEDLLKEARETNDNKVENAKLNECLAIALIGWANMAHIPKGGTNPEPLPFDKIHFDKLTVREKWTLVWLIITRTAIEEKDLGKSNSQRTSDGASTASIAPAAANAVAANASTSPAPSNPS
jgi:hypothetical protein